MSLSPLSLSLCFSLSLSLSPHSPLPHSPLPPHPLAGDTKKPNTIFCDFIGQIHMLTFSGASYESVRCSDGEVVKGSLAGAGSSS